MTAADETVKCRCGYKQLFTERKRGEATIESAARIAGWRIWTGETQGGKSTEFTFCPACAGTASPERLAEIQGWDAECETCGAVMSEEFDADDDEAPITEKQARDWDMDHQCEPEVIIHRPKWKAPAS